MIDTTPDFIYQKIEEIISDKYEMLKELGNGSRAHIYLVRHKNTEEYLAMKHYIGNEQEAKREMEVMKLFKGEGIPYLFDCLKEGEHTCIFMEYIEGKNLRQILKERHILSEEKVYLVMERILSILQRFHDHTPVWIYGDLKPENIMITDKEDVYLVDFGSVIICGEKHREMLGTKAYSIKGVQNMIPFRDIYAAGLIMYEMLTGFTYNAGIENGKADVSHLSQACQSLIHQATRLNPSENFSDAKEMRKAMQSLQEQMPYFEKKQKRKSNYFVGDTKRFLIHGCKKYLYGAVVLFMTIFLTIFVRYKLFQYYLEPFIYEEKITTTTVLCEEIGNRYLNRKTEIKTLSCNSLNYRMEADQSVKKEDGKTQKIIVF